MKSGKRISHMIKFLINSSLILGLLIGCKNLTVNSKTRDVPANNDLKYRYAVGESQSTKKEIFDVFPEVDGPSNFLKPRVITSLAIQVTDTKSIPVTDGKLKVREFVKLVDANTHLPLAIPVFIIEQPYGDGEAAAKLSLAPTTSTASTKPTNQTATESSTKTTSTNDTGNVQKPATPSQTTATTSTQTAPTTATAQSTKSTAESASANQKTDPTKSIKVVTKEMEFKIPDYFECKVSTDATRMQGVGHPLECRKLAEQRFQGMCYSIGDMTSAKALYDVKAKTCTIATTPTPIVIAHDEQGFIDLIALYRKYSGQ